MKNVQPLTIQGPVCGLSLLHYLGDGDEVVLVAHPDPRQGGTMLNKVVDSIAKAYQSMGYHVVTFNYRSVDRNGKSRVMLMMHVPSLSGFAVDLIKSQTWWVFHLALGWSISFRINVLEGV